MLLYEIDSTKPILYVDLDGVLADFFTPFNKMAGVAKWNQADKDTLQRTLKQIAQVDDFWPNLGVLPDANKLLSGIQNIVGEFVVLSKALSGDPRAEKQKRAWVQANLSIQPVDTIIMAATANKGIYAKQSDGTPNVLIDDFGVNIKNWMASGGTAIKHKDGRADAIQFFIFTPKSSMSTLGVPSDCFAYMPLFAVAAIIIVSTGCIDRFACTHALFCFSALGSPDSAFDRTTNSPTMFCMPDNSLLASGSTPKLGQKSSTCAICFNVLCSVSLSA
jgi:hypothetical protein